MINIDQNHLTKLASGASFSGAVDAVEDGCTGAASVGSDETDSVVDVVDVVEEELATVANVVEVGTTCAVGVVDVGSLDTCATDTEVELLVGTGSDSDVSEDGGGVDVSVEIPAGVSSVAV